MLYLALATAPRMAQTGEVTPQKIGEPIRWHKVVGWRELGLVEAKCANDALEDAKARFGGSPVIADFDSGSLH